MGFNGKLIKKREISLVNHSYILYFCIYMQTNIIPILYFCSWERCLPLIGFYLFAVNSLKGRDI